MSGSKLKVSQEKLRIESYLTKFNKDRTGVNRLVKPKKPKTAAEPELAQPEA